MATSGKGSFIPYNYTANSYMTINDGLMDISGLKASDILELYFPKKRIDPLATTALKALRQQVLDKELEVVTNSGGK